ncbi:MAG TPA: hypothetical protein VG125_03390, partial [Pirellulales bacterium]|nr:hypothetical protein [Pirellulales bacterium]
MSYRATICRLLLLVVSASPGCALSSASKPRLSDAQPADAGAAPAPSTAAAAPTNIPVASTTVPSTPGVGQRAGTPPGATPDPRVLDDVLAELATLGPIQPEAQQRLIDDLRKTDPAYWPMLIQTVRASLAYRRRTAQRETENAAAAADEAIAVKELIPEAPAQYAPPGEPRPPVVEQVAYTSPVAPLPQADALSQPAATNAKTATSGPAESKGGGASTDALPRSGGQPASPAPWQQHLGAAVGELERETRDHPQAPDALANQVYLRLLDLTAGRRDEALRPIPGISPGEQDYWSKQLFALSTYLDRQRIGDPSRRAGEASLHLAKAVAALAEQGPLVVRNLAFCTDVHSYGVLKRIEPPFRPGQQLLIYAEVEGFRSEETADGFHT